MTQSQLKIRNRSDCAFYKKFEMVDFRFNNRCILSNKNKFDPL